MFVRLQRISLQHKFLLCNLFEPYRLDVFRLGNWNTSRLTLDLCWGRMFPPHILFRHIPWNRQYFGAFLPDSPCTSLLPKLFAPLDQIVPPGTCHHPHRSCSLFVPLGRCIFLFRNLCTLRRHLLSAQQAQTFPPCKSFRRMPLVHLLRCIFQKGNPYTCLPRLYQGLRIFLQCMQFLGKPVGLLLR